VEIGNDVRHVLDADRETDDIGTGPGGLPLLLGELAMGGRPWMDDQAPRIADIGEMREELDVGDKLDAGLAAALDAERQHRARALRAIFLPELVVAVAGQAGIAYPRHLGVRCEMLRDGLGVVGV